MILLCTFLFRLAQSLYTHTKFVFCHRTHPLSDLVHKITGELAIEVVGWSLWSMEFACLMCINLIKSIVEEWLIYYLFSMHVVYLMSKQTASNHRKFVRLKCRLLSRGKDLIISYFEHLYIHTSFKKKAEYCWQGDHGSFGYNFEEAHNMYSRNLKLSSRIFAVPYDYVRAKLRKPPDKYFHMMFVITSITVLYLLYIFFGILKIWYLTGARLISKSKRLVDGAISSLRRNCCYNKSFALSTGVDTFPKQKRNRRKLRKQCSKSNTRRKRRILALMTIFATTK